MIRATLVQKVVIRHPKDKDKFLLLVRNSDDKSRPGDYDVPGGSLKNGESYDIGLKREVKEETGLELSDIQPVLIKTDYDSDADKYFIYIGFAANALDTNVLINKDEHSVYKWITLQKFVQESPKHILIEQLNKAMS